MRLGLGSYTYTWAVGVPGQEPRNRLSAQALLERAHNLGVHVVQFCDNLPLTNLSDQEFQELATKAREWRMTVEVGTRGLNPENLLAHLQIIRQFRSGFLRVVVDSQGDEPSPQEVVARLRPLLPAFAAEGVKLAIENHDRFTARTLASIVEELGPEQVGVCLDTVNSFGALEGPDVVVQALARYTLNLHVKDFTINRVSSQMGFIISGCATGQGRLNVPWLLQQLSAADRDCNAIIELWTPFSASLDQTIAREAAWAAESVTFMRQYLTA